MGMVDMDHTMRAGAAILGRDAKGQNWENALSGIYGGVSIETFGDANIVGNFEQYEFGDLVFEHVSTTGGVHGVNRESCHIKGHEKVFYIIGMLLSGGIRIAQSGNASTITPNDLFIIDSSKEHSLYVPDKHRAVYIKVPRLRLESNLHPRGYMVGQRIDGSTGFGLIISQLLRTSLSIIRDLEPHQANNIAIAMFDLLKTATADNCTQEESDIDDPAPILKRVQIYIDENLKNVNISREEIARIHHISIRYLNRLFEREGSSLTRWIIARRLECARQSLEDPTQAHKAISEIAYGVGFKNVSHFNRAFKDRFGRSPRSLRDNKFAIS